ncbi:MAG: hypothetical protein HYT80_01270 [Euryarchaeota archaeon]|nr:hypothetical protein [Euryarchaeota archaeon]
MSHAAMGLPILLLSDAVALVAIVAVFGLSLVFVVIAALFLQANRSSAPAPGAPTPLPMPAPAIVKAVRSPRAGTENRQPIEIDVPTKHVDAVIGALQAAGWNVEETGEVVATDDDEEALTTLSVKLPGSAPTHPAASLGTGEEIR